MYDCGFAFEGVEPFPQDINHGDLDHTLTFEKSFRHHHYIPN